MKRRKTILKILTQEHPNCLPAHHIAERLGMIAHYSTPEGKRFIAEIESDLEALASTDPPQVAFDLRRYDMRYDPANDLLRCWSVRK